MDWYQALNSRWRVSHLTCVACLPIILKRCGVFGRVFFYYKSDNLEFLFIGTWESKFDPPKKWKRWNQAFPLIFSFCGNKEMFPQNDAKRQTGPSLHTFLSSLRHIWGMYFEKCIQVRLKVLFDMSCHLIQCFEVDCWNNNSLHLFSLTLIFFSFHIFNWYHIRNYKSVQKFKLIGLGQNKYIKLCPTQDFRNVKCGTSQHI